MLSSLHTGKRAELPKKFQRAAWILYEVLAIYC